LTEVGRLIGEQGSAMPDLATIPPARRPELLLPPLGDQGRYVVKDPRTGAFYTLGEQEYFLLCQLDGQRDAEAICQAFEARFGEPLSEEELQEFIELARSKGLHLPDCAAGPWPGRTDPADESGASPHLPFPGREAPPPAFAAGPRRNGGDGSDLCTSAGLAECTYPIDSFPPFTVSGSDQAEFLRVHSTTAIVPVLIETRGGAGLAKVSEDDLGASEGGRTLLGAGGSDHLLVFGRNSSTGAWSTVTPLSRGPVGPGRTVVIRHPLPEGAQLCADVITVLGTTIGAALVLELGAGNDQTALGGTAEASTRNGFRGAGTVADGPVLDALISAARLTAAPRDAGITEPTVTGSFPDLLTWGTPEGVTLVAESGRHTITVRSILVSADLTLWGGPDWTNTHRTSAGTGPVTGAGGDQTNPGSTSLPTEPVGEPLAAAGREPCPEPLGAVPEPAVVTRPPARRPDLLLNPLGTQGRYVVKDPRSGAFYTLGEQEYFLLCQLDGQRDAEAICQAFEARFGESLSADDLDGFVDLARSRGFLQPPAPPEPAAGQTDPGQTQASPSGGQPAAESAAPRRRQSILYWRVNLFDPDRLFNWLAPRIAFVWTRPFLFASAGCILLAAVLVWANGRELVSAFPNAWQWKTALVVWLTLVVATFCHEFAHGLTCKRYGGEVHEVGFLAMFFLPCFYCNVSDAWLFKEKSKRLWVTLAGGYCDLCLWALAFFAWRLSPPESLANYLAWVVFSVLGGRVFFNFNPLLKLDGYYLLSDWLEIPNLRQRAWERLAGWVRCLLWGAPRPGPAAWGRFLLAYGLVSWLFSVFFLALMLAGFYRFLGARWGVAGAAVTALLGAATLPGMFRGFAGGEVRTMILTRHKRLVAWLLIPACLVPLLWLVQIDDQASGPFELHPPNRAELRAPVAGFLRLVYLDEGERVSSGAVVACLDVPDLDSRLAQGRAAARESEAKLRLLQIGPRPEVVLEQRDRVERAAAWRDLAERDLARCRKALREDLATLTKQIEQHQAERDHALSVFGRSRTLKARRSITDEQYEESEKAVRVARARHEQAQARKREREEKGTREAEMELASREKDLADCRAALRLLEAGSRPEEIEAEQARLDRLREEVQYLERVQGKLYVCSPISGLITMPRLKEKIGRYLKEGDLICEVEEPGVLEAEVALDESEAARVLPGQSVKLKCRALPFQTLTANVDRVAPRSLPAEAPANAPKPPRGELPGTVTVVCRLEGADPGLRPGMTGHARVCCDRRPVGEILGERVLRFVRTEFWW
jgi:putative peptide zinc metalloprotease protein